MTDLVIPSGRRAAPAILTQAEKDAIAATVGTVVSYVKLSVFGFVEGDTSAAKTTNDTKWGELKTAYAGKPLVIYVDGEYHTDVGFHWLDRVEQLNVFGTTLNAGFTCRISSVIAFRVRGVINGARCLGVHLRNMAFKGAWVAANNFSKGTPPNSGAGNAGWVFASPFEVLHCESVTAVDCEFRDSQYDGVSLPIEVRHGHFSGCVIDSCADDGFNPGGDPSQGAVNIENIIWEGGSINNVQNTGAHISGGANNVIVRNTRIDNCGRHAFDWWGSNITFENIDCDGTGQPRRDDPRFATRPGDDTNVDGFYVTGGGFRAAYLFTDNVASGRVSRNIKIKNARFTNTFDRDNRLQRLVNLAPGGEIDGLEVDVFIDNTDIDAASGYSCASMEPLHTGPAGNTKLKNYDIRVQAVFAADNKGGRSQLYVHKSDKTDNKCHLGLTNIGATYAVELNAAGETDLNFNLREVVNGVFCASADTEIAVDCRNETSVSATALRYGAVFTGDNCTLKNPRFVNCGIQLNTAENFIVKGDCVYEGTENQRPGLFSNTIGAGSEGVSFTGTVRILQTALTSGVTAGSLLNNRGVVYIADLDVVCDAPVTLMENSDASGVFKVAGGYVKTAGRLYTDIAGVGGNSISCELDSLRTSGQEVIVRSDDTFLDLVIRRETPYATSPIQSSATERMIVRGACVGTGAATAVQEVNPPAANNDFTQMLIVG